MNRIHNNKKVESIKLNHEDKTFIKKQRFTDSRDLNVGMTC